MPNPKTRRLASPKITEELYLRKNHNALGFPASTEGKIIIVLIEDFLDKLAELPDIPARDKFINKFLAREVGIDRLPFSGKVSGEVRK